MQYPSDDMDDLFRRAAENYPLNTNGANWDKVNAMLSPEAVVEKENNNKRHLLWLLLLLPLSLICNRIVIPGSQNDVKTIATSKEISSAPQTNHKPETESVLPVKANSVQQQEAVKNNDIQNTEGVGKNEKSQPLNEQDQLFVPAPKRKLAAEDLRKQQKKGSTVNFAPNEVNFFAASKEKQNHKRNAVAVTTVLKKQEADKVQTGVIIKNQQEKGQNTLVLKSQEKANNDRKESKESNELIVSTFLPQKDSLSTITNQQKEVKEIAVTPENEKRNVVSVKRQKHFYVGIVGGPDVSTVKFEKFSETGFEAGVVLGYELNKKWAFETGVFSDRKFYSSDGEYLNTGKVYLPANSKITAVTGNCRMIEIPLLARYTFSGRKSHRFFGAAGISSYLMSREEYSYDYLYLTSGRTVTYDKVYTNETKNWVSVLQLSAGYTKKLGGIGNLRIEPYYKIPIKGLGYGELPISSFGIHFGITRTIF